MEHTSGVFQNDRLRSGDGPFYSEEDAAVSKADCTPKLKLVPFVDVTGAGWDFLRNGSGRSHRIGSAGHVAGVNVLEGCFVCTYESNSGRALLRDLNGNRDGLGTQSPPRSFVKSFMKSIRLRFLPKVQSLANQTVRRVCGGGPKRVISVGLGSTHSIFDNRESLFLEEKRRASPFQSPSEKLP